MKRAIEAALALLMSSGAMAQSREESRVREILAQTQREQAHILVITSIAYFAGSQNRCPQFRVIDEAVHAELAAVGLGKTAADRVNLMHDFGLESGSAKEYSEDPIRFCEYVWKAFGPNNNSGEHQMLEAK